MKLDDLSLSASFEDDTPTPSGWTRKLVPRIGNSLFPASIDVIFIGPTGEKFKNRSQLQKYLKANKGSPDLSEFIWITEDSPRRLTRSASSNPSTDASPSEVLRKKMPQLGVLKEHNRKHHEKYQTPTEKLKSNYIRLNKSKRKGTFSPSVVDEPKRILQRGSKKQKSIPSRRKPRSTKVMDKDEIKEVVEQSLKSEKGEVIENEDTKDMEKLDSFDHVDGTKSRMLVPDQTIALMQAIESETVESDKEEKTNSNVSDCDDDRSSNGNMNENCQDESK